MTESHHVIRLSANSHMFAHFYVPQVKVDWDRYVDEDEEEESERSSDESQNSEDRKRQREKQKAKAAKDKAKAAIFSSQQAIALD